MKRLILLFSLLPFFSQAQTDTAAKPEPKAVWSDNIQVGLNVNQASYSDNWKSGGVNSVALSTFLNAKIQRKAKTNEWNNDIQLLYGSLKNKGQSLRKNADRIFIDSKYSRKISKQWNVFAAVNFMSQFDAGFNYSTTAGVESSKRISGFLAPAYITEALGFEYKPVQYFSAQFGVGALRQTIVKDQTLYDKFAATAKEYNELYGVKRGEVFRNQVVFQMVANFDKEIMKNVTLKARYQGLLDYDRLRGQYVISRLDASIIAKVNKSISTNITGVLLYDYDQDKDLQYSQVLNLGVLYTIKTKLKK